MEKEYGISAHRVTIYEDTEQLCAFGFDIYTVKSTQNKYYLAPRLFDLPELKRLIDAVGSSKFITAKKSKELIAKLGQLGNRHNADELRHGCRSAQRVELICDNSVMDYIVDRFVDEVETAPLDESTFQASVDVAVSNPFFGWVFGFDGKIKIAAPEDVKKEYEAMLRKAFENN